MELLQLEYFQRKTDINLFGMEKKIFSKRLNRSEVAVEQNFVKL